MRTRDGRWYELNLVKRMTLCLFRENIEIAKEALHVYVRKKKNSDVPALGHATCITPLHHSLSLMC
jgi:hypothetical protein